MTGRARTDCAVMCNVINTHTHTPNGERHEVGGGNGDVNGEDRDGTEREREQGWREAKARKTVAGT